MTLKVTFTFQPREGQHGILTVQDAFEQALDFFAVLTDDSDKNVIWKLDMASTNSPFTCKGEPIDKRTWAGATSAVAARVAIVERNFERIAKGQDFDDSFPRDKIEIAKRLLKRNTNGIGLTTATFSEEGRPVVISDIIARRYFEDIAAPTESLHSYLFSRTSRKEIGSVEGRIVEIGTDYDVPAIQLVEHKSGRKISCRISQAMADELSDGIKAKDAWEHRRVRVRGTLNYDGAGKTTRVVDGVVSFIDGAGISLDRLSDQNFTEGYSVREYLDRLQENDFGQ